MVLRQMKLVRQWEKEKRIRTNIFVCWCLTVQEFAFWLVVLIKNSQGPNRSGRLVRENTNKRNCKSAELKSELQVYTGTLLQMEQFTCHFYIQRQV